MGEHAICTMEELEDLGAFGFEVEGEHGTLAGFVVKTEAGVRAYVNSCPHTGAGLDWAPHRFLTKDRSRIMCARHGAVFRKEDGHCEMGPCEGQQLTPLEASVVDDEVRVTL